MEFMKFVNDNSKGLNTIVGAVATAAVVGAYGYVAYKIGQNFTAQKKLDALVTAINEKAEAEDTIEETLEEFEARRNGA